MSRRCAATVPRQRACSAARDTGGRQSPTDRGARTLLCADDLTILPAADERLLAAVSEDARDSWPRAHRPPRATARAVHPSRPTSLAGQDDGERLGRIAREQAGLDQRLR